MSVPLVEDILGQAAAIRGVAAHHFGAGKEALLGSADRLHSSKRILLSGMGASLNACIPLSHFLASKGGVAPVIETSELLYSGVPAVDQETAVILVSRSGESVEVTKLLPRLAERGAAVIGVTNVPGSTLAVNSRECILINSPVDQFAAIQSYTASVVVLLLLGAAFADDLDANLRAELESAADVLSVWIQNCFAESESWFSFFDAASPLYLLGRGASLGSVRAGALLMHEVAKAPAVGMPAADFRHGPVEVLDERFHTVIFGSEPSTADLDAALAEDLTAMKGHVRWIGRDVGDRKVVPLCPWPPNAPDRFAPVFEIVPMQIAAYRLAEGRGIVPGEFRYAPLVTRSETGFTVRETRPVMSEFLCVDIGGTSTKAGVVSRTGEVALVESIPTSGPDAAAFVDKVCTLVERVRKNRQLGGLGIAVAGFVDSDHSRMVYNPNIAWLENYPIRDHVARCCEMPVALEVDSNAACMGEYYFGAGRGSRRFLCLVAGTGLGVGMAVDGVPLRFAFECLGDIGHIIVKPDGPICSCGGRGCAEALISAPRLAERYREARGIRSEITLRDVISSAKNGDDIAESIVADAGECLGIAAASMANTLLPERIAIAGGLSAAGDLLLQPAKEAFERSASEFSRSRAALCRGELGAMATLAGAAWYFLRDAVRACPPPTMTVR